MTFLLYKKEINPDNSSLDFENLCIVDSLEYYTYEKHPNICGIPLWMKEEFRKKSLVISGGVPISIFLAKPPSKFTRYCVYDPNTAVSSIFDDATFYDCYYNSPTRKGIRIDEVRSFVEVKINDELYLVDTLTKRILKSSWFKEKYNFEVKSQNTVSKMNKEKLDYYKKHIEKHKGLEHYLFMTYPFIEPLNAKELDETKYEIEQSKKYFSECWKKYEFMKQDFENKIKSKTFKFW